MMENSVPRVSVILPVYNGLSYLQEAIDSILHQSFEDFEFLIINDGSTDASAALIDKVRDPRIRFLQQSNQGLAATLNRAIALSRGQYIARQDQDDVSFSCRLQKQVAFLDANLDIAMVGAAAEIWVGSERTDRLLNHPADDASIRFSMLFDNYFVHSSVMIRRSVLAHVGFYSEDKARQPPEDYELWSRVMRSYKLANLPEVLMAYREVPGSMSRAGVNPFLPKLVQISAENIAWVSDCAVDCPAVVSLAKLFHEDYEGVPAGVTFSEMRAVLNIAMLRIAQESGVTQQHLKVISQQAINRLRYRHLNYCSGGLIGKAFNGRLGGYAMELAKRMMKGIH